MTQERKAELRDLIGQRHSLTASEASEFYNALNSAERRIKVLEAALTKIAEHTITGATARRHAREALSKR